MFLPFFLITTLAHTWSKPYATQSNLFCEKYTECVSVSLLEERLCLGNTLKRPFWLPQKNDRYNCHEKLRNDYKALDKLEEELDTLFLACLYDNVQPFTHGQQLNCTDKVLKSTPQFSYLRTINYVPTKCFTGLERRRERQCSSVRNCCSSVNQCEPLLTNSKVAQSLESMRILMRERASDCAAGKHIETLPGTADYSKNTDVEESWAPTGHVKVKFDSEKANPLPIGGKVKVNVNMDKLSKVDELELKARQILLRKGDLLKTEQSTGEVSNPTGGDTFHKVEFPRLGDEHETKVTLLVDDGGALSIGSVSHEPKLDFPEESDSHQQARNPLPKTLTEHDQHFEKALGHTKEYMKRLSEIANEGVNSLMTASSAFASGSVHEVEDLDNEEMELNNAAENTVTSSPVIVFRDHGEQSSEIRVHPSPNGCRIRALGSKTKMVTKILELLGENGQSDEMNEIKTLIDTWQHNLRGQVLSVKQAAKNEEIREELDRLIQHFDDVHLKLIKSQINASFTAEDYPEEDANIAVNECDPLLGEEDSPEGSGSSKTIESGEVTSQNETRLVDEHGDMVVIGADGTEKLILNGDGAENQSDDEDSNQVIVSQWDNEDYRKELEQYKRDHPRNESSSRNETSCDAYMRCRTQMHLAVDGCAWRFAHDKLLSSLAESAESLLYKGEEPCDPDHQSMYDQLYELLIRHNNNLRGCLDSKNANFYFSTVCLPYDKSEERQYSKALVRILSADYADPSACYHDANKIQQKCSKLRDCCPNFDICREEVLDITVEQAIISLTARINENKQECIKAKARNALKSTIRGLLGKGGKDTVSMLKNGRFDGDIARGAQLLRRF